MVQLNLTFLHYLFIHNVHWYTILQKICFSKIHCHFKCLADHLSVYGSYPKSAINFRPRDLSSQIVKSTVKFYDAPETVLKIYGLDLPPKLYLSSAILSRFQRKKLTNLYLHKFKFLSILHQHSWKIADSKSMVF